jgi:hypothetical protein
MDQRLLLVSFVPPAQATGTPIILQRHLHQLERKGWKVSIVVPEQYIPTGNEPAESWQIIPLPARRWWWPPFRPQLACSVKIRLHLWKLVCERALDRERPSAILTVLWGIYPLLAMHLSKSWKVPLSVIIHDQQELWATAEAEHHFLKQRSLTILNQSQRIWPVSWELVNNYDLRNKDKITVLVPIPDKTYGSFVEWKNHFGTHPVVAHAGSLHPFQIPNFESLALALQKINGTLLLVTDDDNVVLNKLLELYPNVKHRKPFAHNRDVVKFLSDNASCILVSYSFEIREQRWAATSFPSKLVEFSHLGLPVLILASPCSAISNWAKARQWLSHISELDNKELLKVLSRLTIRETWLEMANQTRKVASGEFDPDLIQAQFESELAVTRHLPETAKVDRF